MRYPCALVVGLAILSFGCATADEEYPDAVTADPAHYSVEFENDVARLLRITYGPGEQSVMHYHPSNCSIAINPTSWRMTGPDGEVAEEAQGTRGTVNCGNGSIHLPENSGTAAADVLLMEFRDGATPGTALETEYPGAVAADPDHYSVEFENAVVRILRIAYEPGDVSVMHHHPANCALFLTATTSHMTDAAGETTESINTPNTLNCGDASVHRPANAGTESNEVILIEFKNRAAFEQ